MSRAGLLPSVAPGRIQADRVRDIAAVPDTAGAVVAGHHRLRVAVCFCTISALQVFQAL